MGLSRAAFFAGKYPNRMPMATEMPNAMAMDPAVGVTAMSCCKAPQ